MKFQIPSAKQVDSWRIFPRMFMVLWAILLYQVIDWFIGLENPNMAQSTFVSAITATSSAFFGLYCSNGNVNASVNVANQQQGRYGGRYGMSGLTRRGGRPMSNTTTGGKPNYLTPRKPPENP